ncbi:O-antigen ligase family protein [Actinacidiphila sp. ITFR-21]|uniref:O-antigen ligase family protein n=1 Tax=Actinacidiphila sp. ITFR-21 TaxID=3075199 RepID=UPI00288B4BB8|nr:O-antigen ligase family protein [Streptomyces sp. ITFR-21]WNI16486.1 O-antigen ligase family protein [Streptomyces sp. ITFR-21]
MALTLTRTPAGARPGPEPRRLAWLAPLLPAVATVLLLALPVPPGDVSRSGKVTPADAASAVLVLTCAVRLARQRRRVLGPAAAIVLGAPLVGCALAAATSPDPGAGLAGFLRYAQVFVLVPAAIVLLLRDRRDFAVVAGSVVALALAQGAVGCRQYATGTGASYTGEDIRAVGTFGPSDVMGMATVVAYGLVIAVGWALAPGPARLRLAALGCAGALAVPLVVSFSRGAWIATAVACAAMTVLAGRRLAVRVLGALAACAVLLVGGVGAGSQLIGERVASITRVTDAPDPSVTDRYALWAAAVSMWRQHPLTGVGLKRFPDERDGHASLALSSGSDTAGAGQVFEREPLLSPHNMYLLALAEQGLVGCALLTGSWAALLTAGTARHLRAAPTAPGLAALGLLVWTCVDFLYADIGGPCTVLTAVLLGLSARWSLLPSNGAAR